MPCDYTTLVKFRTLLRFKAGRYAHAKQFKRMGRAIKHQGKFKTLTKQKRKLLKRRQAIEPIIGHLKADHRMDRCHLKGEQGDRLSAVLCAAGYNIKWLPRMIAKKGVTFSQRLYLRPCQAAGARPHWEQVLRQLMQIFPVPPARRSVIN